MVVEEVDLVDIEDVAVGFSQHAGLEAPLAALDRSLDVDRPHHPVLGGVDGQFDHPHAAPGSGKGLAAADALAAVGAERLGGVGVAVVGAV